MKILKAKKALSIIIVLALVLGTTAMSALAADYIDLWGFRPDTAFPQGGSLEFPVDVPMNIVYSGFDGVTTVVKVTAGNGVWLKADLGSATLNDYGDYRIKIKLDEASTGEGLSLNTYASKTPGEFSADNKTSEWVWEGDWVKDEVSTYIGEFPASRFIGNSVSVPNETVRNLTGEIYIGIEITGFGGSYYEIGYFSLLPGTPYVPQPADPVEAFVTRLYRNVLDRTPDADGLSAWVERLKSQEYGGGEAAEGFFFGAPYFEFKNRGLSNEEFLTVIYKTFMDREPDEYGWSAWIERMSAGMTWEEVFDGFVVSDEWGERCDAAGIRR